MASRDPCIPAPSIDRKSRALVPGAGNFKLNVAGFTLDGIGTATFGCIILYHLLSRRERK